MLENIIKLLLYYKSLGDKAFDQLSEEDLFFEPAEGANSISIIVKHLWGNMLSRWTNFLSEDGEKEWRDRDGEFNATIKTREELVGKWEEGWNCFIAALKGLSEDDLTKIIYIRNEGHTVIDAIHRQLAHYSSHIGQIIYIGKIVKGNEWVSLSIPKGESQKYNSAKFSEEKTNKHFTDEV